MKFVFTEEQQMIRDSAESFLAEVSTSNAIRSAMATEQGYNQALWQRICQELCWQMIHSPQAHAGIGLGYVELALILEKMGYYLLCSPFYSTVCLAINTLLVAGDKTQQAEYLPKISNGLTATLAYVGKTTSHSDNRWGAEAVTATAQRKGTQFILNGNLRYVPDGSTAELLMIAAREQNSVGEEGISLFVVPAELAGIERRLLPTMDQTRKQAAVVLNNVTLPSSALMGEEGTGWPQLKIIIDLATIALAAEQLGGAQRVLDMAVAYSKERIQFNRPIASFQSIKHRVADMMTRVEVSRSGVYYAACVAQQTMESGVLDSTQARELAEAASIVKAYCSDAYFRSAGDALQIHGGVGFTWEYDIHLYFKRAKACEHFLGNGAYHRERLATLILD